METETHDVPEAPEPPPRGVHAMAIVRWAILIFTALVAVGSWYGFARAERAETHQTGVKYQCPMHPQIVQDQPGECPICHMTLEPIDAARLAKTGAPAATPAPPPSPPPAPAADASTTAEVWTCPMHPQIHSDHPGQCPICHMDLERVLPDGGLTSLPSTSSTPTSTLPPGSTPPNTMPIHLTLDRVQSIGVRTAVVESVQAGRQVRVTASVAPTEQGVAQVHVRANGFVERIAATQTGLSVGAGQLLFSMYSPEIFQAQSELLAAAQWTEAPATANTVDPNAGRAATAARRKLELLGMSPKDIDRVVQTRTALRAIPVYAPQRGVVTKKNVVLGSYVTPDMTLYELQDLSKVYVLADVFPKDVAFVHQGMKARFALARRPEPPIEAVVDLVYPIVDLDARTTRVRLTLKNPGLELRPGDFGTVELDAPATSLLAVPRDAVVDTGRYAYVFVVAQSGVFEPRIVTLAGEENERALIQSGVNAGDRVVSGATFLVDSESRLQAAVQNAGNAPAPAPSPAHGSH